MATPARKVGRPKSEIKTAILPVRMDEFVLRHLAELADKKGLGVSTMVRMWVLERLADEEPPSFGPWVGPSEGGSGS